MERCSPHGNLATPPFKRQRSAEKFTALPYFPFLVFVTTVSFIQSVKSFPHCHFLLFITPFSSSHHIFPPIASSSCLFPFFLLCSSFLFSSIFLFYSSVLVYHFILFFLSRLSVFHLLQLLILLFPNLFTAPLISSLILPTHPSFSFYLPSPLFMSFIPHSFLLCSLHSCSVFPSPSFSLSCYSSSSHSLLSRTSECVLDLQALRRALQSPRRCSVSGMRH